MWNASTIAIVLGALTTLIGAAAGAGFGLRGLTDSWLKVRKDRREDKEADRKAEMEGRIYEDNQAKDANKALIDELTRRLNQVDTALSECHSQHLKGVESVGVLTGRVEILTMQNKEYRDELALVREEVHRLKRHEENNLANVAVLKQLELHHEELQALKQAALVKSPETMPITAEAKSETE